jgi:hypothetical protein
LIVSDKETQATRGEEAEVDPDQFQNSDHEYGLFAETSYEQDDEEADKILDENMDARRPARRCVLTGTWLVVFLLDAIVKTENEA